ncbi:MAG TPA: alpha-galactosidase [Myxococcota bacterium]|nr:alpha-galactosidase [Myxococcota bacterium]HQK49723.1 alpha-galactosidase [Myxococcota bacterium]
MRRTLLIAIAVPCLACGGGTSGGSNDPGRDLGGIDVPVLDPGMDPALDAIEDPGSGLDLWQPQELPPVEDVPDTDAPAGPLEPREADGRVTVSDGRITLVYDLSRGTFDLGRVPGQDGLIGAHSEAVLTVRGDAATISSSAPGPRIQWQAITAPDELGDAVVLRFDASPANSLGGIATYIALHRDHPAVTLRSIVVMPFREGVVVQEIRPVVARFEDGATLMLGPGTRDALVLDNGREILFDFLSDLRVVGTDPGGATGPGLASNWTGALCTPSASCLVAGFVTQDRAMGLVTTDHRPGSAVQVDGQEGLSRFELRSAFLPPTALEATRVLSSDVAWLDFTTDAHEGLVRLGRGIARYNGVQALPDPLSSWNSWGGGTGSGGRGSDIDEAFILANLEAARQHLVPYGLSHFLVDDGWAKDDGSWTTDESRFPRHGGEDGMKWLAGRIREAGLVPGIWTAPFRVRADAPLLQQHPDWVLPLSDLGVAALGGGGQDRILDPSLPAVQQYLGDVFRRLSGDWGYRVFKVDFSVYAIFGQQYGQAGSKSGLGHYRQALRAIREAIGPEGMLMVVAGTLAPAGIAESVRLTLDNEPRWQDPESWFDQGIKPTVLTASHRYWMGNTAFVAHPDLIFFREGLTADEARTFALWASLFGGVLKLGEPFTWLADHQDPLDLFQRMLPAVAVLPEPLDLWDRRWPETWEAAFPGPGGAYRMLGAFHWGNNANPWTEETLSEVPRTLRFPMPSPGEGVAGTAVLDTVVGEWKCDGTEPLWTRPLDLTLSPRTGTLLVARPAPEDPEKAPWFLATDRHLLGGVAEVAEVLRDPSAGTLEVRFARAVAGRPVVVHLLAAAGSTVQGEVSGGGDASLETRQVCGAQEHQAWTFLPSAPDARLSLHQTGL